jgi:hypothetical protein
MPFSSIRMYTVYVPIFVLYTNTRPRSLTAGTLNRRAVEGAVARSSRHRRGPQLAPPEDAAARSSCHLRRPPLAPPEGAAARSSRHQRAPPLGARAIGGGPRSELAPPEGAAAWSTGGRHRSRHQRVRPLAALTSTTEI